MRTDFNKVLHRYDFEIEFPTGKKKKRIVGIINAESGFLARANLAALGYHGDMIKSFSRAI